MKVMFCIGAMSFGGAERVIINLANKFVSDNNDVIIVNTIKSNSTYECDKKVGFDYLDNSNNKKNFVSRNILRIKKLKHIVDKFDPEIIISFLPEPSFRILVCNLFNKRKIIVSERNDPKREYDNFIKKTIVKLLYKRVNGFVFQTEEALQFFNKKIKEKSIIIPNPLNDEFITKTPFKEKRKNNIVTVGRLEPQKNQKLLIDAFYKINRKIDDYKLIIYGEGSLREKLENYIEKIGMKERIFLPGQIENVKKEIFDSSLFVLPSDYEGMPNALMESLALGVPSISTNCPCGGPNYLIKNGINGFLVPVNDINEMANKMLEVLKDKKLGKYFSKNSIKISETCNSSIINKQWIEFIRYVLSK